MDSFIAMFAPIVTLIGGVLLTYIVMRNRMGKPATNRSVRNETDRLFRIGFEKALVGIGYLSVDGTWLYTNNRLLQILGYERSEFARTTLRGLTHSEDRKREAGMMASVRAGRSRGFTMNKRLRRADGNYETYRFSIARLGGGSRQIFQCVIDEAAEESELQNDLAAAFDRVPEVSVIRLDPQGKITSWNRGAEELFGYSSADMMGKPWTRLHLATEGGAEATRELAIAASSGRFDGTDSRKRSDESILSVEIVIVPQFRGKDVIGFIEVCRDATLNHTAKEYQTAYERVKKLSEEKITALAQSNEALRQQIDQFDEIETSSREVQERLRASNRELTGRIKVFSSAVRKLIDQRKNLEETIRTERERRRASESEELSSALPSDLVWQPMDQTVSRLLEKFATAEQGILVFRSETAEKRLTLRSGTIVTCSSNSPDLLLGQVLVDEGAISESDRSKMIEVQEQTGIAFGRLLVLFELVSEDQVQAAMERKVRGEIAQLNQWSSFEYAFFESEIEPLQIVPVEVPLDVVVELEQGTDQEMASMMESSAPVPKGKKRGTRRRSDQPKQENTDLVKLIASSSGSSTRFHVVGCSSVKRIPKSSRILFRDVSEAEKRGLSACKRCVVITEA